MTLFEFYMYWLRWFLYGDLPFIPELSETEILEVEMPEELTLTGFINAPFSAK